MTLAGSFHEFAVPTTASKPCGITSGPDGIRFTETSGNNVARMTTSGVVHEFPIPTPFSQPQGITVGPDGNIWFVEGNTNKVGVVVLAGCVGDE